MAIGKFFFVAGLVATGLVLRAVTSKGATSKGKPKPKGDGGGGGGGGGGGAFAWTIVPADVPPGDAFYSPPAPSGAVSQVTGQKFPTPATAGKKDSIPNGSIVTIVLAGPPNGKSEGRPPLAQVEAKVVANYTGAHAPHVFQNVDPDRWYYDVMILKTRNVNSDVDLATPVLPPPGRILEGIPAFAIGSVESRARP